MREIKFRAWDEDNKQMDFWEPFRYNDNLFIRKGQDKTLMQYTGLKDKNKNNVFESDIVKGRNGITAIIKFGDVDLGRDDWGINHLTVGFYCEFSDGGQTGLFSGGDVDGYGFNMRDCEIIGNIYENPEKLKK